jgi:glycosyltransferase involved in cell wall biosynthesis
MLAFPSETDTFGLVILEAFASGVPAVVTNLGGPQYTVRHESTGYIAGDFDEFADFTARLMSRPELLSTMRVRARQYALATSWDRIFEGMYEAYARCLSPVSIASHSFVDVATI